MASAYEGGLMLDESAGIDIKADCTGDAWLTIWTQAERVGTTITLGLETDELRELAGALVRCADAADEARQTFARILRSAPNGLNGRH